MKQLHNESDFDLALASGHALLITDSASPGRIHSFPSRCRHVVRNRFMTKVVVNAGQNGAYYSAEHADELSQLNGKASLCRACAPGTPAAATSEPGSGPMVRNEADVVDSFEGWLIEAGWVVRREVDFVDLVAARGDEQLYVEAKGPSSLPGGDADAMYGQILRRMPAEDDPTWRFAVVVPQRSRGAVLRVSRRVRDALRIDVFVIDDDGTVEGPLPD